MNYTYTERKLWYYERSVTTPVAKLVTDRDFAFDDDNFTNAKLIKEYGKMFYAITRSPRWSVQEDEVLYKWLTDNLQEYGKNWVCYRQFFTHWYALDSLENYNWFKLVWIYN